MTSDIAHHRTAILDAGARYRAVQRVTIVGAVINIVLAGAKILFGIIGRSQALVVDGIHSLSDLVSDAMVLVAARHGSRDADEDHPYGHARVETAVTVGLGVLLIVVGVGIGYDTGSRLFAPKELLRPDLLTLIVALLSIVSKEGLYHYTVHAARRARSNLLQANAWHHRSDAISSVVVAIGIGGTMAGLPYLDAIAAVIVALMIAKIGWDLSWQSLRELVDTGLDREQVAAVKRAILAVDGVQALHLLRSRRMGRDALVDVHILVDPKMSVSEGHQISETVRTRLMRWFDEISDVLVHIDSEDDEVTMASRDLPLRDEILDRLHRQWRGLDEARRIERVTLHYLEGRVDVEVVLPLDVVTDLPAAQALARALARRAKSLDIVGEVRVHFGGASA
jgi:cation diffusion facilitator family transporter